MTNETNPIIPVELPLNTWRFIRDILLTVKRIVDQPRKPYQHRSHILRLIDHTLYALNMLQDAAYTIADTIIAEGHAEQIGAGPSVHPPIETTFPEVKL